MVINDKSKSSKKFVCENCNYVTSRLSQYNRHILTYKHKKIINGNFKFQKVPKSSNALWVCNCGKQYKYDSGLSRHKKYCNFINEQSKEDLNDKALDIKEDETKELKELVVKLMVENQEMKNTMLSENIKLQQQNYELQKQNKDIQKHVLDVCKINNSNNTINSHNKTFNLQFFLNEQCKDAMNITDFANSISVQLKDLEKIGSSGYVNGISSIIIKELKELDVTKRPVHCSDAKRETLYIKDEDKWEKECPENTKMKKVIRNVEKKNINLISEWTDKNPAYYDTTTTENDEYLNIMQQTMGGKGDYEENKNKIIKKIAKEVVIDK